jgi:murein DD-endopeptidase MepM/ murein hydrolase activator NlpD
MLGRRCRLLAVLTVVLALFGSLATPAGAATSSEMRRLRQTRARITQVRQEMEAVKAQRDRQQQSVAAAQRQVNTILAAVGAAEEAVDRQQTAVEEARVKLDELRREQERKRAVLRARALRLYKQGSGVPFAPILSAHSPADAMRRASYVDILNRADHRDLEGAGIAQVAVAAQRRDLEAKEGELRRMLAEQRALLAQVESIRDSRLAALSGVAQRLRQLQAKETHLSAESRRVAALSRRSSARTSRSSLVDVPRGAVGGWGWPTRGPVTSEYGRRWGRMHEGIDIGAPTGAGIYAARAGVVSFAGKMSGYGNLMLVDHGDGIVTAYAHQSSFIARRGARVNVGQLIGRVGCSGHCTGPHLHFEVRVSGSPRNPRRYLP